MTETHYIIRGGAAGRERLRLLARALTPSTGALLSEVSVADGARCLDAGCGGGDVTLELARRAGPRGSVLGVDIDDTKLAIARDEAASAAVANVSYEAASIESLEDRIDAFDVAYARFLLSHLPDPEGALATLVRSTRRGGSVVLEDVDFAGCFCHPRCDAYAAYCDLYVQAGRARGADPEIGRRLPRLAYEAGLADVQVNVEQPASFDEDVKLLSPCTFENIADTVVELGLTTREEVDAMVDDLYTFAVDPGTILSFPRIVQVWGQVA